jgi:hypothetical protein
MCDGRIERASKVALKAQERGRMFKKDGQREIGIGS